MDNINTLSGLEFEKLCQALLMKLGFDVETTKQSGDGGIDLIAYNHQPFYSGKYIVQCKRYAGSVGEPIVRDLYGVVMAEHANKGILITTGHFTMSASRFAQNKNIELIDGETLPEILAMCGMSNQSTVSKKNHFTQFSCFDKGKYDFYKSMISENMCTREMASDFLFDFLFKYLVEPYKTEEMNDMIHNGFSEEFLRLCEWYTGKYYKKNNLYILKRFSFRYRSLAQLYSFNLFEYVQNRYEILTQYLSGGKFSIDYRSDDQYRRNGEKDYSRFYLRNWNEEYYQNVQSYIIQNLNDANRVRFAFDDSFLEIMNLLSIFNYFKISKGIDYINKILFGDFPELSTWVQSQPVYINAINDFTISYKNPDDRTGESDYCVDMSSYFDRFIDVERDKISDQIEKINNMLSNI